MDQANLIESREPDAANIFAAMAGRIARNPLSEFGGAFVVVPPPNGGEPIETLVLDSKQNGAQFWSMLKTKCEIALNDLSEAERAQRGVFGR